MTPKKFISTLFAVGLAWLAHAAPVAAQQAGAWTVARLIGTAWIINPDRTSTVAQTGSVLLPGQTFATSPNGRAMIVSGQSVMMLTPGTLIAVKPGMDGKVVVLQQAGQLKLHVEHRDARYFSVETPYLAALVKGTTFSVHVKNRMAKVDVAEGSVQVDGFIAGKRSMLGAGQSAAAMSNGAMAVEGQGIAQPAMTKMEPRAAEVKPSRQNEEASGTGGRRDRGSEDESGTSEGRQKKSSSSSEADDGQEGKKSFGASVTRTSTDSADSEDNESSGRNNGQQTRNNGWGGGSRNSGGEGRSDSSDHGSSSSSGNSSNKGSSNGNGNSGGNSGGGNTGNGGSGNSGKSGGSGDGSEGGNGNGGNGNGKSGNGGNGNGNGKGGNGGNKGGKGGGGDD